MTENKIEDLLIEKFKEETFQDCFLIEVTIHPGNVVIVVLDSDAGVTIDKCQKINRFLEKHLDENGWLGAQYSLEVSSPGATQPLVYPRQYPKHVGRKLALTLLPQETAKIGKLIAADQTAITIEEQIEKKEGKKKLKETITTTIPYDQIKTAIVQLAF